MLEQSLNESVADQADPETYDGFRAGKNFDAGNEEIPASDSRPESQTLQIKIKPRSLESLHMTLFFGGEILCDLSPEELIEWHSQVEKRIQQSFLCEKESAALDDSPDRRTDEYWFRLKELTLFPPPRKNLIVASLEASSAWHLLHDDIRAIAEQSKSEKLRGIVKQSSFQQWKPHITLANLRFAGARKSQRLSQEHLQKILKQIDFPPGPELHANGIAMGGPIPNQALLNWDFSTTRKGERGDESYE